MKRSSSKASAEIANVAARCKFLARYKPKYKFDMSSMKDDILSMKEPVFAVRPHSRIRLVGEAFPNQVHPLEVRLARTTLSSRPKHPIPTRMGCAVETPCIPLGTRMHPAKYHPAFRYFRYPLRTPQGTLDSGLRPYNFVKPHKPANRRRGSCRSARNLWQLPMGRSRQFIKRTGARIAMDLQSMARLDRRLRSLVRAASAAFLFLGGLKRADLGGCVLRCWRFSSTIRTTWRRSIAPIIARKISRSTASSRCTSRR